MKTEIAQDKNGRYIIPPNLIGIRDLNMKHLINDVIDGQGQSYKLYFEIKQSSLKNHYDIRFFSTYSGAKNPKLEQTKWKTTIPADSIKSLRDALNTFL